jgi:hypothetical protein
VSVSEGIRQNLDNQKKEFIQPFFSTMQYVMAGNDTEGLRYGTIQTPEKYYLTWKEAGPGDNPLDKALRQLCAKARFLELIHDFVVFDAGTKKLCRHNQYFGVRAAQATSGAARAACCGTPRARARASPWCGSPSGSARTRRTRASSSSPTAPSWTSRSRRSSRASPRTSTAPSRAPT